MAAPPLPTGLASPEELLEVHAQLEGLLQLMRARAAKSSAPPGPSGAASQAQGRQGRYKKVDTARKSSVQVFATTHSQDCIRGLASLVESRADLAEEVSMQKVERSLGRAVRLDAEGIQVAVKQNIEVR